MSEPNRYEAPGPFRAAHINPGDRWEISNGRPIECAPTGGDGARTTAAGARVLATDPDVDGAGIDAGFSPSVDMLRAPDIAVGNVPDKPGWIQGVPPLAVEYAGTGQDEAQLQRKIGDLLDRGTRWIWVVRLDTPRRVEVYTPGEARIVRHVGELLTAPGVLRNPVPVEALFDETTANRMTLRNLLQREGYESLDAVREEGVTEGVAQGRTEGVRHALEAILTQRFGPLSPFEAENLGRLDGPKLDAALGRAISAPTAAEVLGR